MKRFGWLLVIALAALPGCRGGLDADADRAVADKALKTAMEAWKSGKSQADLEKERPPIIFNEDDWRTGKLLLDFKMEESALSGRQIRCRVRIKLQDKDKRTVDSSAVYIIDTTPRIVIVRDSFAS